MRGFTALYVPGYDHAGISTQSVVEKRLAKIENLSRHDLGREEFLRRCMAWKEECVVPFFTSRLLDSSLLPYLPPSSNSSLTSFLYHRYQSRITSQIQRLGISCDWDRVAFTMDPALSKAVAETFVRLHDDGIIYRANRLVNWCVAMNTTLSNLEVRSPFPPPFIISRN